MVVGYGMMKFKFGMIKFVFELIFLIKNITIIGMPNKKNLRFLSLNESILTNFGFRKTNR